MRLLLVFLNEPIPGMVNTRLAQDVGKDEASRYYQAMVEVLLRQLQGLQDCRIRFCYTPDDAGEAIRFWLLPAMRATAGPEDTVFLAPHSQTDYALSQEVDFRPQGDGDFGARIERAFSEGFDEGYDEIAIIGPNCLECGARWINAAFSRLHDQSSRDAVIGPSTQGNYYLLILKSNAPELFDHIPWRGEDVSSATLAAARRAGLYVESLPRLDEIIDLRDWQSALASPLGAALKKALGEPPEDDYAI